MGIRMNQFMGLTEETKVFLSENALQVGYDPCPHCGKTTKESPKKVKNDEYIGMYDEGFPLYTYTLKNGGYAVEKLQEAPWSSGPVIFFSLTVHAADNSIERIFKWSREEIEGA